MKTAERITKLEDTVRFLEKQSSKKTELINRLSEQTANLKELVKAQKEYIYIIDNQLWLAKPSKYYDKYCQLRKRITELNNNLK